jgi:hypothetical protein
MKPSFVGGTFPGLQDCEIALFEKYLSGLSGVGVELGVVTVTARPLFWRIARCA